MAGTASEKPTPRRSEKGARKPPSAPAEEHAAPAAAGEKPAPGLDDARHAAGQRTAHRAEVLRTGFVPACMTTALGMDGRFDADAFRCYLDQFLKDAGDPRDSVERALVEQIAFAHLRVADLHALAAGAKVVETIKVVNGATARLLGEVRRTALALQAYRERAPAKEKIRLAKVG